MTSDLLFPHDNPFAQRGSRTDRLIIGRLLEQAAQGKLPFDSSFDEAHAILGKWAELEASGALGAATSRNWKTTS